MFAGKFDGVFDGAAARWQKICQMSRGIHHGVLRFAELSGTLTPSVTMMSSLIQYDIRFEKISNLEI